jgi:MoaA/NifB/PqqE/SkfB family radical SAM enzyme
MTTGITVNTDVKNKKYFCYEIYKNLAVWSQNGKLGYNPCSFFNGYIKTSSDFKISEVWNSPEHNQLKKCVENDIPISGCQACYDSEADGIKSRRQGAKELYEEFHNDTNLNLSSPQGLDYSVGNLCNLKCVICGPSNSSQWVSDYQQLFPGKSTELFRYKKYQQLEIDDHDLLQNLKSVHFHGGGEPLLSDNHVNLLLKIQEVKGLADVRVFYNTNGTQIVSDKILQLWEKCKLIELYFSIDDLGPRFEYQRTNARWTDVESNLTWFYKHMPHNHMFNINCTWGYLNFFYLDEMYDWWKEKFSSNRYKDPTNLIFQKAIGKFSLDHLSPSSHQVIGNKFQNHTQLQSLLNSIEVNNRSHANFWKNISDLDRIRKTDFRTLNHDWSKLIS